MQSFTYYCYIQVSENGVISFDRKWMFDKPQLFPTNKWFLQSRDVIAPFWSDNDIRKAGTVRYVLIEKGKDPMGDSLLEEADLVVSNVHKTNFTGQTMLIAQWDHVHPYPHGSPNASVDSALSLVSL